MTTRIIMRNDGRATADGETEIFGTSGRQTVTVLDGASVTFRSGFNTGGDIIRLNGRASDFTASISGSNVTLRSTVDNITIVIPIGSVANTITFDNGDSRALSLVNGVPMLGGQMIGAAPAAVTAGPGTFTITGAASVTEGGVITYTVTRTDTTAAETLLFSVDGSTNGGVVAAATQGADFSPASGVITFAAGAATATFTVAASSDTLVEGLEGISVRVLSGSRVVAETNATIIDGASQGQNFTLSAGTDTVPGTGGNDTITGRISDFQSFDAVAGGAGIDTLVLTGALPTDANNVQPAGVVDGAFAGTTGVERLVMAGGTPTQSSNATLGALARAAGLTEVVAGGTGAQAQVIDILAFDGALTVTGSANAEVVNVSLATSTVADGRVKTLNLGAGTDVVNVTTPTNAVGSVAVNFISGAVGNGTSSAAEGVRIGGGSVLVNDEGTVIQSATAGANVFNVVGLAADGTVDANQNRGNFARVELGTNGADAFDTQADIDPNTAGVQLVAGNIYYNAGAGNDTFNVLADAANERHFIVGGAGNDTATIATTDATARVVGLMGNDNDTVTVNTNAGAVDINLGDGDDSITFTGAFGANRPAPGVNDVVAGGTGRDTLATSSLNFSNIDNTVPNAVQTISGFEALTVRDVLAHNLVLSRIQAGIDTMTLAAGTNGFSVTFDSGVASTLNLGAAAAAVISVASAGTGTNDRVTIASTAAAVNGVGVNVFNGQGVTTAGVETLVINSTTAGTAPMNGVVIGTIQGTPAGAVEFVGSNSVTAVVEARTVNASGLTGTAGIIATTTGTDNAANAFTGSNNADTITLGAGRQNLNLGGGNDTVIITATNAGLLAGTSRLNGGEGTDTIQTTAAIAATLSGTNVFNANNSGFEVLSINQGQAPVGQQAIDTIRVDNLGVNKVISAGTAAGTPGTGNAEVVVFTAPALAPGQSIRIDQAGGLPSVTYTNNTNMTQTSATVADQVRNLFNGPNNAGTLDALFNATSAGGVVTLTGTGLADVADLSVVLNNAPVQAPAFNPIQGVNAIAGTATVTNVILDTTIGQFAVFNGQAPGQAVTFNGAAGSSFTLVSPVQLNGLTPELANLIKAQADADPDFSAQYTTTVVGNNVRFTSTTLNANLAVTINDPDGRLIEEDLQVTQGTAPVPATLETTTVVWQGLLQGQSVTVAGRTVTATTQNLSATEVANAFEQGQNNLTITFPANGAQVSGSLVGWELPAASNAAGDPITNFRALTAGNVADLSTTFTSAQAPLAAAPMPTITQGTAPGVLGAAGQIVLQNLASGGTLEITGASTGTHDVRITNAGLNTNDVLNLELTNSTNGTVNYGTVTTLNVERVNVLMKDTGTAANTAATQDVVNLVLDSRTTSLFISGENGVNLTGSQGLSAVTLFDATGISGGIGDSLGSLGVAFTSQNNTTGASVTIRGGIGHDDLIGGQANDTFDLSRGGSDLVQFAATRTLNGNDVINGFTGGALQGGTINVAADVLDLNGTVNTLVGNAFAVFNTATATADLTLADNTVYRVVDGQATLTASNVKDATAATAQNGEILVGDNFGSAYVLHASATNSNVFTVYRVFDGNAAVGVVSAQFEVLGTVNMTNTFGDLTADNLNAALPSPAVVLTAPIAAAPASAVASATLARSSGGSFAPSDDMDTALANLIGGADTRSGSFVPNGASFDTMSVRDMAMAFEPDMQSGIGRIDISVLSFA